MKFLPTLAAVVIALFSLSAHAAGYALHGTYLDFGPAGSGVAPHRVPAVLYVAVHGRVAQLTLNAPGARCVPEFGASGYVGPAHGEGFDALAIHVEQKGDCNRVSDDARLVLRFAREFPRGVLSAELTDQVRGASDGPMLFEANGTP